MRRRREDPYRDGSLFDLHAAPEPIRQHLKQARAAQVAAQRRVAWLESLLERRTAEIAAGTWPPRPTTEG